MDDSYLTIERSSEIEIKVKGSRFIARTFLIDSSENAADSLESIRRKEYSATHNCYAYIVGHVKPGSFKYSDDGEPSGTAGKPIYDTIAGRELTDILLVVTRYFGGTKLGTGGLVRAYSRAAVAALDQSGVRTNFLTDTLSIELEISKYDQLQRLFQRFEAISREAIFSDKVKLVCDVRKSRRAELEKGIVELSSGNAKIKEV